MKTDEQKTVKPALLAGFQDVLPERMIPWQKMIGQIRRVFESFGFVPLETPGMERLEVLTGGSEDFNKSIYATRVMSGAEDRGKEILQEDSALRFDLTVPLARVVAAYPKLPRPFKRYQIGRVWRGEKPQANRYREFMQFDADIIGSFSIRADTEIVQLIYETLRSFGLPKFVIRVSDRRVLNGLADVIGVSDRPKDFNRMMDKVDEFGVEGLIAEFTREPEKAFDPRLVLSTAQGDRLREFLTLQGDSADEILRAAANFIGDASPQAAAGVEGLKSLAKNLTTLGIPEDFWRIDLAVARGLDYYSGPVFETNVPSMPEVGSIFSGGRFDGLTARFIAGSKIPGVGASVGVDRLFTVLTELKKIKPEAGTAKVLVTVFSEEIACESLLCGARIRARGIPTEVYLGEETMVGPQIIYALKQGAKFAVIIGPEESAAGKIALRDLTTRKQEVLTEAEAVGRIVSALGMA